MQRWHIFFFSSLLFSSVRMSFDRGRPTPSVNGQISNLRSRFLRISPYFARTTGGEGNTVLFCFAFHNSVVLKEKLKVWKKRSFLNWVTVWVPESCTCLTAHGGGKKFPAHILFVLQSLSFPDQSFLSLTPNPFWNFRPVCEPECQLLEPWAWSDRFRDQTGLRVPYFPLSPEKPLENPGLSIWTIASDKQTSTSSLCWRFRRETLTGGLLAIKLGGAHTQTHTLTRTRTQWSTSDFNKPQTFFQAINNKEFQPNRHCL